MCGEEQQLNLVLQFMGEYLDYQGRGEEREGSSFLHSVLTSLFLGVAHISRNDRIIFQTSAAVWLECPAGQRAFVRGV